MATLKKVNFEKALDVYIDFYETGTSQYFRNQLIL